MSVNSNQKGKRGEREAAAFLRQWFPDARRSQQYNGDGDGDVVCPESLPGLHIEVKFGYSPSVFQEGSSTWRQAVNQATRDAAGKPWCVLWKPARNRWWRITYWGVPGLCTVSGDVDGFEDERIADVMRWLCTEGQP